MGYPKSFLAIIREGYASDAAKYRRQAELHKRAGNPEKALHYTSLAESYEKAVKKATPKKEA